MKLNSLPVFVSTIIVGYTSHKGMLPWLLNALVNKRYGLKLCLYLKMKNVKDKKINRTWRYFLASYIFIILSYSGLYKHVLIVEYSWWYLRVVMVYVLLSYILLEKFLIQIEKAQVVYIFNWYILCLDAFKSTF